MGKKLTEFAWKRNLVARDCEFLRAIEGKNVALMTDTGPLDKSSQYHVGHYTATWREDGRTLHRHLACYVTNTQTGEASRQNILRIVAYFSELTEGLKAMDLLNPDSSFIAYVEQR